MTSRTKELPVNMNVNVKPGEVIRAANENGPLWVTGCSITCRFTVTFTGNFFSSGSQLKYYLSSLVRSIVPK